MKAIMDSSLADGKLSVIIRVTRLDAAIARDFKNAIDGVWREGVREVEINMEEVEFVDSSGIGALLSVYRKLPEGSGATRLLHVKPSVLAVIELLRLHRIFEIVN